MKKQNELSWKRRSLRRKGRKRQSKPSWRKRS